MIILAKMRNTHDVCVMCHFNEFYERGRFNSNKKHQVIMKYDEQRSQIK